MASQYIGLPPSGGGTGAVDSVNGLTGVVVLTKSNIGLGNVNNTSDANKPISTATQTALDTKFESGDVIIAADGSVGAPGLRFTTDSDSGFFQTGDGNVSVAANGTLKAEFNQNDIQLYSVSGVTVNTDLTVTGNIDAANFPPTGSNNTFAGFDGSGDLFTIPNWNINSEGGCNVALTVEPDDVDNQTPFNKSIAVEPTEAAPASQVTVNNVQVNLDAADSGFEFGTGGNAVFINAANVQHQGSADIGAVNFTSNTFNLGNGTDPIDVNGFSYAFGQGQVNANVTISGPMQGYGYQPSIDASATITNDSYAIAFYDFSNIDTAAASHTSANFGPSITEMQNNNNYQGLVIAPTIDTFTGNSGASGIGIFGNYGTFDTGGFQGLTISPNIDAVDNYFGINSAPNITSCDNATGLNISMSGVTGTNVKAAQFDGDVSINGNLNFSGALSIGKLTAFATQAIIDGGGAPTSINMLVSAPTIAASTTVANGDTLGLNTAMLLTMGDNSVVTTGFIGVAALALPAVVSMGTGATVDRISAAAFALSLDPGATGGTIGVLDLCRAVSIPNGVTTVTAQRGFKFDLPFGDPATTTWGFYSEPTCHNYFAGNLLIGGTAGSDDTVTNSSVGLELKSTTKAMVVSRMTGTERDALTAINGMVLYNSTTDKLQVRAAGAWVDLH